MPPTFVGPLVLGIDPGAQGGVGIIDRTGKFVWAFESQWSENGHPHSATVAELRYWLTNPAVLVTGVEGMVDVHAVGLEEPTPYFRGEVVPKSAGLVARSAGVWLGLLAADGVHASAVRWVQPRTWQAAVVGKLPKGTKKQDRKAHSKALALRIFGSPAAAVITRPGGAVHEGMAEALLIAEWRRQVLQRDLLVARR